MESLTKRRLDATKPDPEKEFRLWDSDPRGFGVRIKSSGVKTFFIQYRSQITGKKVRHTIGQYGRLTLEQARSEARKHLGAVEQGADPAQEKRIEQQQVLSNAGTVSDLCEDYLRDAKAGRVMYRGRPKKPATLKADKGRMDRHIIPLLGSKIVRDITPADISAFYHDVRLGKTAATVKTGPHGLARVTGGNGAARRVLGLLGSIFSYAVKCGLRPDNPVAGVERSSDGRRERTLSPKEYRRLGAALSALESKGANPVALRAIRALAVTGCRRGEIYALNKTEIDPHSSCLRLGDTKTGQQVRPIGQAALDILTLPEFNKKTPYVFPAAHGEGHLTDAKLFRKIREKSKLEGVTLHTLRHSFASTALELEYSELTIAGLLGHRLHSVTSRYAHHVDRALVAAADRVAALISARMEGREVEGGEVVTLRR